MWNLRLTIRFSKAGSKLKLDLLSLITVIIRLKELTTQLCISEQLLFFLKTTKALSNNCMYCPCGIQYTHILFSKALYD